MRHTTLYASSGTPFGRVQCPMYCVAYTRRWVESTRRQATPTAPRLRGPGLLGVVANATIFPLRTRQTAASVRSTGAPLTFPRPVVRTDAMTCSLASMTSTGSTRKSSTRPTASRGNRGHLQGRDRSPTRGKRPWWSIDLGVEVGQHAGDPFTLGLFEHSPHYLHVLLRHRRSPFAIGVVALVVGVRFLSPRGLPAILGYRGVAEQLGSVGGFMLGAGGAFTGRGSPSVRLSTALDLVVAFVWVVASHPTRPPRRPAPRRRTSAGQTDLRGRLHLLLRHRPPSIPCCFDRAERNSANFRPYGLGVGVRSPASQ